MAAGFDLDAWYRRFGEAVHRRARRILHDDAGARDAVQETFLRAWRYQSSWAGGSALVWLFTICDRVCFDALKKRGKSALVSDDDVARLLAGAADDGGDGGDGGSLPIARPPRAGAKLERDQLVHKALCGVDDETRQILVHRYLDELDTAQIATALSTSERTVRRRLNDFFARARARLAPPSFPEVRP